MLRLSFVLLSGALFAAGCDAKPRTVTYRESGVEQGSTATPEEAPVPSPAVEPSRTAEPPHLAEPSRVIEPSPATALQLVTGPRLLERIRASNARGTLVNVWASWCGECKRELPMLVGLASKYKAAGVDVVFVSVDETEEQAAAVQFLKDKGAVLPSLIAEGELEPFKVALNPRWKGMIPASFLYDATGTLRYFWGGPAFEEEVTKILDGFLAGQPIDGEATFGISAGRIDR